MVRAHARLRERYSPLRVLCAVGILSLLVSLPGQITAQAVLGELLDEESGRPVATAQVVLVDSLGNVVGRALSDSAGRFFIAVDLGTYSLVVNRLSYEPQHVADVEITNRSILGLRIRLSPDTVQLPGLVVQGARGVSSLRTNGFYDRQKRGFGHFMELERIQRLQALKPTELVRRMPGVVVLDGEVRSRRAVFRPGGMMNCLLQVVVDGSYRGVNLDDVLIVDEIEGIEVYNGLSNVPARWQGLAGQGYLGSRGGTASTCGVIVVWTKR